ncbi:hypothetical protein KM043_003586 [Ampulex compressa]|nr:hypothetical protein KM043_003586 [Ampulex compressa]
MKFGKNATGEGGRACVFQEDLEVFLKPTGDNRAFAVKVKTLPPSRPFDAGGTKRFIRHGNVRVISLSARKAAGEYQAGDLTLLITLLPLIKLMVITSSNSGPKESQHGR